MIGFKSKKIDITPDFPVRLTGMKKDCESYGVHSLLEINAFAFCQKNKYIYIYSIDTLFITDELKNIIIKYHKKINSSVNEKDILIMSTHTHYAPSIEENRLDLGVTDERYFEFLVNKIEELIIGLEEKGFIDIIIDVSSGKTSDLTSNRRRKVRSIKTFFKTTIAMEPNLKGFKNEEFKIVKFIDRGNLKRLLGVLWSFPCHPTNLYDNRLVSAEFPGAVRDNIRVYNSDDSLSIIYMPGSSGDVRAYPPKRHSFLKKIRTLFHFSYPVSYYRFINKYEYDIWVNCIKESFWRIWLESKNITDTDGVELTSRIIKKEVSVLGINSNCVDDIIFRKISFGDKLSFYTISAEPVSEYSKILIDIFDDEFYIFTGYSDNVFGYLPTQKQIEEGGYESEFSFNTFLITGNFHSKIEEVIKSAFCELK